MVEFNATPLVSRLLDPPRAIALPFLLHQDKVTGAESSTPKPRVVHELQAANRLAQPSILQSRLGRLAQFKIYQNFRPVSNCPAPRAKSTLKFFWVTLIHFYMGYNFFDVLPSALKVTDSRMAQLPGVCFWPLKLSTQIRMTISISSSGLNLSSQPDRTRGGQGGEASSSFLPCAVEHVPHCRSFGLRQIYNHQRVN